MKKVEVAIEVMAGLFCPECDEHIDLYTVKPDNAKIFSVLLMIKENKEYEFTCPECNKKFIVSNYEITG